MGLNLYYSILVRQRQVQRAGEELQKLTFAVGEQKINPRGSVHNGDSYPFHARRDLIRQSSVYFPRVVGWSEMGGAFFF